jgi:hypothetical protein
MRDTLELSRRWRPVRWMRDQHTTLRHSQQAGVDLEVITAAMGHTSTTVTKLYADLSNAYKRNELMKMAPRGRMAQNGTSDAGNHAKKRDRHCPVPRPVVSAR